MPLTDAQVRTTRPAEKAYKKADGGGLYLFVSPSGGRLWRMNYRFDGKGKTLSFGSYPDVGLADAREKRDAARKVLAAGLDPAVTTAAPGEEGRQFRKMAERWVAARESAWTPGYTKRIVARLENDVYPVIGARDLGDVSPRDVVALLRKVEDRGSIVTAKRLRQYISGVYAFAIADDLTDRDPAASVGKALKAAPKPKRRAKLPFDQIGSFVGKLRAYDGERTTGLAIELILHTWVRTIELRFARWSEIEGDLWRIPEERLKMDREHLVPLTSQAQAVLAALRSEHPKSEWIAPGPNGTPMSENTLLYALYRMGYRSRATVHGLRGTASTAANESGLFHPDWVERQLAHDDDDDVRAAYNSAEYLPQRRKMMKWWGHLVETEALKAGVLPLGL